MGKITQILGSKKIYKSKEEFLNYCINDHWKSSECVNQWTIDDIEEGYAIFNPKMPEGSKIKICDKQEDTMDVYILKI